MIVQENIGKFIAQERKRIGMTQEQFAEKLGVSNRSISRWENGKTMPDISLFPFICEEFGISITELLTGKKAQKIDMKEKICLLIDFFGEENRKKIFWINRCYIVSVLCMVLVLLHTAYDIFEFARWPEQLVIFLLGISVLSGSAGLYYSGKKRNYTEKEIAAFLGLETSGKYSTAGEMLLYAKRNQKIELKQYEKAFQAIEKELTSDEEIVFSMIAENLVVNEEWRDGWKPWHIAIAVSAQRILISGESIRGRFMTFYDVESYEVKDYLETEVHERNVLLKFKNMTMKISGNGLKKSGEQLKIVLDQIAKQ